MSKSGNILLFGLSRVHCRHKSISLKFEISVKRIKKASSHENNTVIFVSTDFVFQNFIKTRYTLKSNRVRLIYQEKIYKKFVKNKIIGHYKKYFSSRKVKKCKSAKGKNWTV